jgi:hypothetical protein
MAHTQIQLSGGAFNILDFASKLKKKVEQGSILGKNLADIYASKEFKAIQNLIPSSDEKARAGFPGEKHGILKLPNGKFGVGNFIGPGTEIVKRLKRGDLGRTPADTTAMRHDLDYFLAQLAKTKKEQARLVREADKRMVATLKKIKRKKLDSPYNIALGMKLIQLKMAGEDIGAIEKGSFGGLRMKHLEEDTQLAKDAIAHLKKEGY